MKQTSKAIPKHQLVAVHRQAVGAGVPMDSIDARLEQLVHRHDASQAVEEQQVVERKKKLQLRLPVFIRFGALALQPLVLVVLGLFLVGNAVVPILNSYITEWSQNQVAKLVAPNPFEDVLEINPTIVTQAALAQASTGDTESSFG